MVEHKSFARRIVAPLVIAFVYALLYLPIVVLTVFSFNDSANATTWNGFSFRWYKELVGNQEILKAFQTSLIVAFGSSFLSIALGTAFVFAGIWWRSSFLYSLFYLNILLPDILLAIGVLSVFVFFNIPVGYGSLIAGHTLLGLGFAVPILRARFAEINPILTEASLDLGATYPQTFARVVLPLMMPTIFTSFLLAFTLSLDDFLISFFCASHSVQPLSVYVYAMARTGIDPTINALSACFLVLSSLLIVVLCAFKVADQVIGHD